MGDAELYQALQPFNTHWAGGVVSDLVRKHPSSRRAFRPLKERIRHLPFEVLVGPRQVGKTTLMGHLMAGLVDSGVRPSNVAYVLLDQPAVRLELAGSMDPVIKTIERFVLKGPLTGPGDPFYLFLDEVHVIPDWDVQLKSLYDLYHPRLRVLASGSSSAALSNARTGDFTGRIDRVTIFPMKFGEVVTARYPETAALATSARNMRTHVPWHASADDVRTALAGAFTSVFDEAQPHKVRLRGSLDEYIVRGGYPAVQPPTTDATAFQFFQTMLLTILSTDLKVYPNVRKPQAFPMFLARMARGHGGKFVSTRVATDLGLDKETPATWKGIAEELFLLRQLPQLNDGFRPIQVKADKAYVQDPGVLAFLLGRQRLADLEASGLVGLVVEGMLFDHLLRLQFNAWGRAGATIGYLDSPEIDFVVEMPSFHLAVESKYRREGASSNLDRLRRRTSVLKLVVTRDEFDVSGDTWSIPAWLFLFVC